MNELCSKNQSAYRKYYSTETALLRVTNDLLSNLDNGDENLLILDYSAAFDVINHQKLLSRLSIRFGFSNSVLNWFKSYFTNRLKFVKVDNILSCSYTLTKGVPQGSVMGPIVFVLYSSQLESVLNPFGTSHMSYADDVQIYSNYNNENRPMVLSRLSECVSSIKTWSLNNDMKFNNYKTTIVRFHSSFRKPTDVTNITIGDSSIKLSSHALNLGVIFDSTLSFTNQINKLTQTAYFALHKISKICKYLDKSTTSKLIHALVTSRLDYCNAILVDIPNYQLNKLQRIQNSAARLITGVNSRQHITPILYELHWLPVKYRIQYKVLLMTYKALNGIAPQYIKEILTHQSSTRTLRSNNQLLLQTPRVRTQYGRRAFNYAAPMLWNALPLNIKTAPNIHLFKTLLKTHLFQFGFS